ncbi:sigma-70 family RNA polymerase sigma factor [Streptomyces sp. NPDC001743]|uniref:sigma-70 family RNA polymerase sigma factor n=1 Tax=Streptomyces sp. NPDC001743 TaxID=3154397 RepID=UPI0033335AA2
MLGHRRLSDAQPLRRRRHRALLGHGQGVLELAKAHRLPSPPAWLRSTPRHSSYRQRLHRAHGPGYSGGRPRGTGRRPRPAGPPGPGLGPWVSGTRQRRRGADVTAARGEGFARRIEPYRSELLAYCYRMLGSAHDAEDLVQDTCLRAWRAREQYDETRGSLRTWLYRIATNVCLTALEARGRRPLPSGLVAASEPLSPLVSRENTAWLQPMPDSLLGAADPAGTVIERSSLRLAFAAVLQHLSARQRGALILREVLGFSAAEAADILGTTVASVNSSLQRARARVKEFGGGHEQAGEPSTAEQRAWIDRYMKAFERADVEGIQRLLTDDVIMEMPPVINWFAGRGGYGLFMEWVFEHAGTDWSLKPVAANGQPGFAAYRRVGEGYELHTLQILTVTTAGISRNSVFREAEVFASFGLAARLDAQGLPTA